MASNRPGKFFQAFDKKAKNKNEAQKAMKNSASWFQSKILDVLRSAQDTIKDIIPQRKPERGDPPTAKMVPGQIYMFTYDPKHKKTLPYYDTWPLLIPTSRVKDGFYGMNLHYLPPRLRAALLDKIIEIMEMKGITEIAKYRLTSSVINSLRKMPEFAPCIHRYLNAHVRSLFTALPPEDWEAACWLSTERFEKASKSQVWIDSMKKMGY